MPRIELFTTIHAPIARVFDLARSIDLHSDSLSSTAEKAVGGVTSGLIGANETVTWRARHFGVSQHLTSRITHFEPSQRFSDRMVRGAFKRFDHDHFFTSQGKSVTLMRDVFDFDAPLGPLGHLANVLFLTRYMRKFLLVRNTALQAVAESERWRQYLPAVPP